MTSLSKLELTKKSNNRLKKDTLLFTVTFREETDHRRTKSCLAATPGSDTSLFLRLNLSAHKTGLCPSVTNNQEGTGGGTLVLSHVCVRACARVVPSSNSVVMGDQISMVWEWSHTHTAIQRYSVCARDCHHPEHQPIVYLPSGGGGGGGHTVTPMEAEEIITQLDWREILNNWF